MSNYSYKCIVPGCKNNNKTKAPSILFHCFPKNEDIRKVWIENVGVAESKITKSSRVCSVHFTSDCYEHKPGALINISPIKRYGSKFLARGSVPTIFGTQNVESGVGLSVISSVNLPSMEACASTSVESLESVHEPSETLETDYTEGLMLPRKRAKLMDSDTFSNPSIGIQCVVFPKTKSRGTQLLFSPGAKAFGTQTQIKQSNKCHQAGVAMVDLADKTTQTDFHNENKESLINQFLQSRNDDDCYDFEEDEEVDAGARSDPLESSFNISSIAEEDVHDSRSFEGINPVTERKFIVFEAALLQLFAFCSQCLSKCSIKSNVNGSMITIETHCPNNHRHVWSSQPLIGRKPALNILTAAAILFSGLNPGKTIRMFQFSQIVMFDLRTYYRLQKAYLFRAIKTVWHDEQKSLLDSLQGQKLEMGGDGRFCSPGFCAKYGSYTFLEARIKKVIHLVLLQSNQVKNSVAMELEGLKLGLKFLFDRGLEIAFLVTDRHIQIRSFLRKHYPQIRHLFDVWHLVKSVKSKIAKVCGKKKTMEVLLKWSKSIQNHLYWIASSSDGDGNLMQAKWKSILRHVTNKHRGHGEPFPECAHGTLEKTKDRPRKWLKVSEIAFASLKQIIDSFVKDIAQLAWICQTSSVEAFHAVVIQFAPKHTHYSFHGMEARLYLAALHYNENSDKLQAITKNGERRWNIFFPKYKAGEYSVRPIMAASTYRYVENLMATTCSFASEESYQTGFEKSGESLGEAPKPLASKYEHPSKSDAVASYEKAKRFKKQ